MPIGQEPQAADRRFGLAKSMPCKSNRENQESTGFGGGEGREQRTGR